MKAIPPPLPKKVTTAGRSISEQTRADADDNQAVFRIVGLVLMILLTLGLFLLVVSLTHKSGSGSAQSTNSNNAGMIGAEKNDSVTHDAADMGKIASEQTEHPATESKSPESPAESASEVTPPAASAETTSPEAEQPKQETSASENESDERSVAEPEQESLTKVTRVIPLFSEPSAASAPRLEASNPFLDIAKANSIVFVIDKSSSMSQRLGRVINALNQAIDKLGPDQSFQVIFFDDVPRHPPKFSDMIKATEEKKKTIVEWIKGVNASGGTEPLDAVKIAIDFRPARIVILSDGEFNPQYVETITQYNSGNPKERIRIDCIGLDEVVESLQQIAKQNGPGIYYQAR